MSNINKLFFERPQLKSFIVILSYIILMIVSAIFFTRYINRESLQEFIIQSGKLGIFIYFLIEVFYVTFTPLLNTFILIASGYLFGGNLGFVINFLSIFIGLLLIVFLVKKYGRPLLQKIVAPKFYQSFDKITEKVGPIILLVIYVLPFTPDDELTYIIAAGPTKFKRFILPIVLGTIAKSAYSYIGDLGARGVTTAFYFRVVLLVLGILFVGLQEYFVKKTKQV